MATIKQMEQVNERCAMFMDYMLQDTEKVYVINDFRTEFPDSTGKMMSWSWADKALCWLAQDGYISVCQHNGTSPRTYRVIKKESFTPREYDHATFTATSKAIVLSKPKVLCDFPHNLAAFMGYAKTEPKTIASIRNVMDHKDHVERQQMIIQSQKPSKSYVTNIRGTGYMMDMM